MKKIYPYLLFVLLNSCKWELPVEKVLKTCQNPTIITAVADATNPKKYTFTLNNGDVVYPINWQNGGAILGTSTSNTFSYTFTSDGTYNIYANFTTNCGEKLSIGSSITINTTATIANTFSLTDPMVHTGLQTVVVTNDGTVIANESNNIKVWNFQAKTLLRTLQGHTNQLTDMVLSIDEKYLFTSSYDNNIIVFDWKTGNQVRTLTGHTGGVYSLAISADNKYLVSSSSDKTIKIWNVSDGTLIKTITNDEAINNVSVSNDAKYIAGINSSNLSTVKVWDGTNGSLISTYSDVGNSYSGVAFSPDGTKLYCRQNWTNSAGVKVYSTQTKQVLKEIPNIYGGIDIRVSPDGKYFMTGNSLIDTNNYNIIWTKFNNQKGYYSDNSTMSPNSNYGVQWQAGNIALFPLNTGEKISTSVSKFEGVIHRADFAQQKKQIVINNSYFGNKVFSIQGQEGVLLSNVSNSFGISVSNNYVLSTGCGEVVILKQSDGSIYKKVIANRYSNGGTICGVATVISPDDSFFVTIDAVNSNNKNVDIYDINSGTKIKTLVGHSNPISNILISPDSKQVVTYSPVDKQIKVWEANTGINKLTITTTFSNYSNENMGISSDGKYLATTDGGLVKIFNFLDGTLINTINNSGLGYTGLGFSPDNKYLAGFVSGSTSKLRIWKVSDGAFYKEANINYNALKLTFNENGTQIYVVTGKDLQVFNVQ